MGMALTAVQGTLVRGRGMEGTLALLRASLPQFSPLQRRMNCTVMGRCCQRGGHAFLLSELKCKVENTYVLSQGHLRQ